jgi:hypothetical protein
VPRQKSNAFLYFCSHNDNGYCSYPNPPNAVVSDTARTANKSASPALQIRLWEKGEGLPGNAFLYLRSHNNGYP